MIDVSSSVVTALLTATGASLTALTVIVSVLAVGSVSMPPLAVPPLSWTLKPIWAVPLWPAAGTNRSEPLLMAVIETGVVVFTALAPLKACRWPAAS